MENNKLCGIYLITSPNGSLYVGQSKDIEKRFYYYRSLNCNQQRYLYHSLKKHGVKNHSFDIIELCSESKLNSNEEFYISYFKYLGLRLLNLTSGGDRFTRSKESIDMRVKSKIENLKIKHEILIKMSPIEKFKRELVIRRYRISTVETYCSCMKIVFSKVGEQPEVEEIKDFLLTIKNASYHKQFVGAIHRYFEFVLQKNLSLKDIPYPKRNEQLPDVLSIEEVKLIYDSIVNRKHRAIFSLLYGCGLRVSEVINLKLKDIDRSRMIINIKDAKGGKDRQVMLSSELLLLLEEYYKLFKPKEYLFNGHLCDTYSDRSINEFLKTYTRKAGIKKRVHAHKLRHCFATHLLEAGTEMILIQKLLGHKNIKTTQIYSHVSTKLISKVKSPFDFITGLSSPQSHPQLRSA